jgi:hypothetical protein
VFASFTRGRLALEMAHPGPRVGCVLGARGVRGLVASNTGSSRDQR